MWLFFVVIQLTGTIPTGHTNTPIVRYSNFKTEAECKATKVQLQKWIASEYPSSKVSLSCVKIEKMGNIA